MADRLRPLLLLFAGVWKAVLYPSRIYAPVILSDFPVGELFVVHVLATYLPRGPRVERRAGACARVQVRDHRVGDARWAKHYWLGRLETGETVRSCSKGIDE